MRAKKQYQKKPIGHHLYGKHAVLSALANDRREIKALWLSEKAAGEVSEKWRSQARIADRKTLDGLVEADSIHQGFVVELKRLPTQDIKTMMDSPILVLLDQVTDPHNIGAIMRSAAAFGAGGLVQTKDHAPLETAVMAKSASGALEVLPRSSVTNLSQTIKELKKAGFWCIGLDGHAQSLIGELPCYDKVALVLGAEGRGLRQGVAEQCDVLVKLPMSGAVESLNVSNAAAVALYAISTQKQT